jgi:hypothetical protein
MKPYGIPRTFDMMLVDPPVMRQYGLKGSTANLRGKGGDIRSSIKNSNTKREIRRSYKRKARQEGAAQIIEQCNCR